MVCPGLEKKESTKVKHRGKIEEEKKRKESKQEGEVKLGKIKFYSIELNSCPHGCEANNLTTSPIRSKYVFNKSSLLVEQSSSVLYTNAKIAHCYYVCIGYTIARSGLCAHKSRLSMYTRGEAEGYTRTSGL